MNLKKLIFKLIVILSLIILSSTKSDASLGGSIPVENATAAASSALNDLGGGAVLGGIMVTPLWNLVQTTQWDLFFTEFEISLNVGWCSYGVINIPGFKARMIEPVGYFETSKTRWNFLFANINLSTPYDFFKTGASRNSIDQDANGGGRDDIVWSHYIKFPIFGLLFGSNLQFVCFTAGGMDIFLFSEFLPGYTEDVLYVNLIPQNILMYNPITLIASVVDCAAATTVNTMHGFTVSNLTGFSDGGLSGGLTKTMAAPTEMGAVEFALNSLRNTFYYSVGCLGFSPVGGYVSAEDPGEDNEIIAHGQMNLLHGASTLLPIAGFKKQTEFYTFNPMSAVSSMCFPVPYPQIAEAQYLMQRAGIPRIGTAHVFGTTPVVTTSFANLPGSGDGWVNLVWEYRDYYAFAYHCPQI